LAQYSEYLDGMLPESARERFEVHLARCASCARYDRVLRRGLELARGVRPLDASPDFEQRLQHGIFHLQDGRGRRARLGPTSGAALAAVVGLLALVTWRPLAGPELPAFESDRPGSPFPSAHATSIGGADPWFVGAPPVYMDPNAAPSLTLAFPGPYSPLVVQPPLRGGTGMVFMSLRLE
jgi:hypothetical protein